jgi:hypothetical protein
MNWSLRLLLLDEYKHGLTRRKAAERSYEYPAGLEHRGIGIQHNLDHAFNIIRPLDSPLPKI